MRYPEVIVRAPRAADERAFLEAVRRSRRLHGSWVSPESTPREFRAYLKRVRRPSGAGYLICLAVTGEIAGVVNVTEIVRGCFQSAYLGYFAFAPHAGRGCMKEGLGQVLSAAFGELGLHRLEANIQPANRASIALVRSLGFRKEGLSPRYLKIGGRWRDHERWAILAEEWRR